MHIFRNKKSSLEVTVHATDPAPIPLGDAALPVPVQAAIVTGNASDSDGAQVDDTRPGLVVDFAESFRELGVIIVSFLVAAVLLVAALWLRADDELDDVAFLGIVVLAGLLLLSAVGLSLINAKMLEKTEPARDAALHRHDYAQSERHVTGATLHVRQEHESRSISAPTHAQGRPGRSSRDRRENDGSRAGRVSQSAA